MRKITSYATEEDIVNVDPLRTSRLNFGGGLYMHHDKNGYKYFQYRISLNGRDSMHQIGKYPDITFAQARTMADEYRAKVINARKKNRETSFDEKLKRPKVERRLANLLNANDIDDAGQLIGIHTPINKNIKKFSRFKNMYDAGQFLIKLSKLKGVITDEVFCVIYLQLLIPSKLNCILDAHWNDFGQNLVGWSNFFQLTIKPERINSKNNKWIKPEVIFLSQKSTFILQGLKESQSLGSGNVSLPIFPGLHKMSKSSRNKEIINAIKITWPNYHLELEGFRHFFNEMANKHSYFRPEFIAAMMANNFGDNTNDGFRSYALQMHALADWWANELQWVVG